MQMIKKEIKKKNKQMVPSNRVSDIISNDGPQHLALPQGRPQRGG